MILIRINNKPRLREEILVDARMEKSELRKRPKFIYYRLQRGIRNIFKGIRRMFNFRVRKKREWIQGTLFKISRLELAL